MKIYVCLIVLLGLASCREVEEDLGRPEVSAPEVSEIKEGHQSIPEVDLSWTEWKNSIARLEELEKEVCEANLAARESKREEARSRAHRLNLKYIRERAELERDTLRLKSLVTRVYRKVQADQERMNGVMY